MKLGLDLSSLASGHKFRGIGFYTQRLNKQLQLLSKREKDFSLVSLNKRNKNSLDIIHYPYFYPFFKTLPLISLKKTIITIHDLIPLQYPQYFPPGLRGKLAWLWQKIALKSLSAIITDSKYSQKQIKKFTNYPINKIFVVYLAADKFFKKINNNNYLNKLRNRYKLPEKFILYVGDLNWNKNVNRLAQSCLELKLPLVVVGKQAVISSYDQDHIENKPLKQFHNIAKNNAKLILRIGFVPTEDLVGIYNLATCCAQLSLSEGFGLPVAEAMACGCPVLVSRGTSLSEIAGASALSTDPLSKKEITKQLKLYWQNNSLRKKYSSLGLKQSKKFSWEKTARETLAVYRQVWSKQTNI